MAAGDASRLGAPMGGKGFVTVAGVSLLEHLLREAIVADVRHVCFYVRPQDVQEFDSCMHQYSPHFDSMTCLTSSAGVGTGGAMLALVEYFGREEHAICAIDLFARPGYLERFFTRSEGSGLLAVLAVTDPIHDDAPIYVETLGDWVSNFGKEILPSDLVFGHLRWHSAFASERVREAAARVDRTRDSLIVREVIRGHPGWVSTWYEDGLFDIDDREDLALCRRAARAWAVSGASTPEN